MSRRWLKCVIAVNQALETHDRLSSFSASSSFRTTISITSALLTPNRLASFAMSRLALWERRKLVDVFAMRATGAWKAYTK